MTMHELRDLRGRLVIWGTQPGNDAYLAAAEHVDSVIERNGNVGRAEMLAIAALRDSLDNVELTLMRGSYAPSC